MTNLISAFVFKNAKFLDFLLAEKMELLPVTEMLVLLYFWVWSGKANDVWFFFIFLQQQQASWCLQLHQLNQLNNKFPSFSPPLLYTDTLSTATSSIRCSSFSLPWRYKDQGSFVLPWPWDDKSHRKHLRSWKKGRAMDTGVVEAIMFSHLLCWLPSFAGTSWIKTKSFFLAINW